MGTTLKDTIHLHYYQLLGRPEIDPGVQTRRPLTYFKISVLAGLLSVERVFSGWIVFCQGLGGVILAETHQI